MKVAHVKVTLDRKTGKKLHEETIGYEEMDEDEYYRPLVEMFWSRIKNEIEKDPDKWFKERKHNGHPETVRDADCGMSSRVGVMK